MTPDLPQELKIQLALAIAEGKSAATWARKHHRPRSTAYRWAADPQVRCLVQSCRRRSLQRALGRTTRRATRARDEIAKLAAGAESDPAKLRALRSILADAIPVSKFSDLNRRMAAIEHELTPFKNPKKAPLCLTLSHAQDAFQGGDRTPHLLPSS
jgi:hypothetical protein